MLPRFVLLLNWVLNFELGFEFEFGFLPWKWSSAVGRRRVRWLAPFAVRLSESLLDENINH